MRRFADDPGQRLSPRRDIRQWIVDLVTQAVGERMGQIHFDPIHRNGELARTPIARFPMIDQTSNQFMSLKRWTLLVLLLLPLLLLLGIQFHVSEIPVRCVATSRSHPRRSLPWPTP